MEFWPEDCPTSQSKVEMGTIRRLFLTREQRLTLIVDLVLDEDWNPERFAEHLDYFVSPRDPILLLLHALTFTLHDGTLVIRLIIDLIRQKRAFPGHLVLLKELEMGHHHNFGRGFILIPTVV